jgi:hypothetical protein
MPTYARYRRRGLARLADAKRLISRIPQEMSALLQQAGGMGVVELPAEGAGGGLGRCLREKLARAGQEGVGEGGGSATAAACSVSRTLSPPPQHLELQVPSLRWGVREAIRECSRAGGGGGVSGGGRAGGGDGGGVSGGGTEARQMAVAVMSDVGWGVCVCVCVCVTYADVC